MKKRRIIQIATGQNADSIEHSPLADYSRKKGWKIVREYLDIVLPEGKELKQLERDLEAGIIEIVLAKHSVITIAA